MPGQYGLALATIATKFGLECEVYMGTASMERQIQNVAKMKLLGAKVVPVEGGGLSAAVDNAFEAYLKFMDKEGNPA